MNDTSLSPIFLPSSSDITSQVDITHDNVNRSDLRHSIATLPFNTAYDIFRSAANSLIARGHTDQAIEYLLRFDNLATRLGEESPAMLDIHAALMQILTAIYLRTDMLEEARLSAANALNLLAQSPRRKDEPFLAILASLLYDIALMHNSSGQHTQAERAIEKSMKLFDRLAKANPTRYGSPHLMAINASTAIYHSRDKQLRTLAEYQVAANTYMRMLSDGIEDAGLRLVETLAGEGHTLVKMNKHREAIQYFSRAIKYLTKISPEFDRQHLILSIDLGEALLANKPTREKGIHLLNTMLYKATKINAGDQHRRIVDILLSAKNSTLDIFGFWHKLFPR